MAEKKKSPGKGAALRKLKADLAAGTAGSAYIFYGEESYLREYYLGELRKSWFPRDLRPSTATAWRGRTRRPRS